MPLKMLKFPWLWLAPLAALAAPALAQAPKPAQDQEPRPAIWLLADEDTKIYLFGTNHMLPPGFKWRSPALEKVVKEADELVVETLEPTEGSPELDAFLAHFVLDEPVPLLSRVPKKHRKPLKAAVAQSGLPLEAYAGLKTWAAAMMLGMGQQLQGWGAESPDDAPGVEEGLEADFRAAGKPIGPVEAVGAGMEAFSALSEEEQVKMLVEDLGKEAALDEEEDADTRAWVSGRFEERWDAFIEGLPPVLYEGLIRKRNAAWTEWLGERLKKPGTVLFAVGAGHLAGPDSVQKMLAERGLTAGRVE